jgi:protein TonB
MLSVFRQSPFAWTLLLAMLVHAALFWVFRGQFELPRDIPPQEGRASIRLVARLASEAKAVQQVQPVPPPATPPGAPPTPFEVQTPFLPESLPLPIDPEGTRPPTPNLPEPMPAEQPAPPTPEPTREPVKPPREVPRVVANERKETKQEKASQPSRASQASVGARVDEMPREWVNPAPAYPPEAVAAGLEGTVWLHVKIDAAGKVIAASVNISSGYASLDASALRTIRYWVFQPARRNGRPVPFEFLKGFEFFIRRGY